MKDMPSKVHDAMYEHTTADKSCEGEIKLTAISDQHFDDAGHALQWATMH